MSVLEMFGTFALSVGAAVSFIPTLYSHFGVGKSKPNRNMSI